ncbi:sn-glycerol-3-phosphate ABC transporter ATP-binding protein UgpC [Neorhizobium sp. CSC1952]|uniref:ABC transporter ATP-binding protein n=1 Tax=Neorhizobium sp. CSC1952 TaxID=2978974 RepID=UPI0025A5F630|nr:sn-glycerol-3-phosphate ABC transporter ATP-binding protein UgpC [Rhizobium sp. CSC1952]WJR68729.1 sn-glycerol-3-phosphate ABC transporter ATP-binding protein UgpC [Rhizobium sp. CSC1952]
MSSVSIRNLQISFGALNVLETLDLEVQEGEFIVLLGPSGCGKSTLLNAIAGLLDITEGQIWIDGRNVTWAEPHERGIGMVFQSYALYPRLTVEGNLSFGLKMSGMPKAEIARRVLEAARILQLEHLLQRQPAQLSGGQRQRVAIGRALVRNAKVLLFDEPLSNLDAKLRTELRVEIKRLHKSLGSTMIFVTHDQVEALTLADRVAVMHKGVIQQLATPKEIYQRPINRFVAGFVGSPQMNFLPGTLVRRENATCFRLRDGSEVNLTGYVFSRPFADGQPATLGIRPEQALLRPSEHQHPDRLEAVFTIEEPMGPDTLLWGTLAGESFSVRISSDQTPVIGAKTDIYVNMAQASLFDEAGDRL